MRGGVIQNDYPEYRWVESKQNLITSATDLLMTYGKRGLRTLDSIQLASALTIKGRECIYITSDDMLKELFQEEGLNVLESIPSKVYPVVAKRAISSAATTDRLCLWAILLWDSLFSPKVNSTNAIGRSNPFSARKQNGGVASQLYATTGFIYQITSYKPQCLAVG